MIDGEDHSRFNKFVSVNIETSCWEWLGYVGKDGYGKFRYDGEKRGAHRFSYLLFVGEIPSELEVDHLCKNRKCVNPAHLEAVTHAENLRRADFYRDKLVLGGTCERGHRITESNLVQRADKTQRCRDCTREYQRNWIAEKRSLKTAA